MARSRAGTAPAVVILQPPPPNAIVFVDRRHGWAGGRGGLVATTDGRTFRVEVRAPIIGISAFDRARAWALTADGFVLRTSDGRHWSRLGAPHLDRIQFVDARVGFGLTGDGVLLVSGNAGVSWVRARSPGTAQSECFATRERGWIARRGTVWTTHDGGSHWIRARLRPEGQGFPLPVVGCRGRDAWVVFHEGAAAGTEGYHVYRSLGGGPWRAVLASLFQQRLPVISNYAGVFDVLGHGTAVFTGGCAACDGAGTTTIVRTLDGGRSFSRATPFHGYMARAVSFVDARRGWLLTTTSLASATAVNAGVVWSSADGGRHWRVAYRSPLLGS